MTGPDPCAGRRSTIVCAAFFMTVLDVSIVNVALPSIGKALALLRDDLQWVITAYSITFGGFLLLGGRAADLLGRRRMFIVGVVLFTIASFLCGLALVRGRADRRARGAGARRGDHLAGGALDHHDDVRGRPGAQQGARHLGRDRRLRRGGRRARRRHPDEVPRLGVDLLRQRPGRRRSRSRSTPRVRPREPRPSASPRFDVAGAITVTAGLALLVYAVSKAPDDGWASGWTIGRLAIAAALLVAFLVDRVAGQGSADAVRASSASATVAGANVAGFLLGAVVFANFFLLTLYVQQVLGWSALKTGLTFIATAGTAILGRASRRRSSRGSARRPVMAVGFIAMIAGMLWYTQIPVHASLLRPTCCRLPARRLRACRLRSSRSRSPRSPASSAHEAGLASGLINTAQQIGGAIGVAVVSSVSLSHFEPPARRPACSLPSAFTERLALGVLGLRRGQRRRPRCDDLLVRDSSSRAPRRRRAAGG